MEKYEEDAKIVDMLATIETIKLELKDLENLIKEINKNEEDNK